MTLSFRRLLLRISSYTRDRGSNRGDWVSVQSYNFLKGLFPRFFLISLLVACDNACLWLGELTDLVEMNDSSRFCENKRREENIPLGLGHVRH